MECSGKSVDATYPSDEASLSQIRNQIESNSDEISAINTDYFFRYYAGSFTNIEMGLIKMTDRYLDNSGGRYSTSTGEFTIPVNGRYRFFISILSYNSNSFYGRLLADGNEVEYFQYNHSYYSGGTDQYWPASFSFERKFTSGQKVKFYIDYRYRPSSGLLLLVFFLFTKILSFKVN